MFELITIRIACEIVDRDVMQSATTKTHNGVLFLAACTLIKQIIGWYWITMNVSSSSFSGSVAVVQCCMSVQSGSESNSNTSKVLIC